MTDTPPYQDLLSLIDDRSAVLRAAVAIAPDVGARVPGCPDWRLSDLVGHLGRVQRFWSIVVAAADPSGPPPEESLSGMEPRGDLLEWSAGSTGLLLDALRSAGPDSPAWTWWAASGAPMTAGAIARHQVQEAAVHAYDAQETIGKPEPLPAAVAVDGVPEFLGVGVGSLGAWPHRPARVSFVATDGPTHVLDLSPSGAGLDPAPSGDPVTAVHASSSDLVLALYGRIPFDTLRVEGDREVPAQLRRWSNPD